MKPKNLILTIVFVCLVELNVNAQIQTPNAGFENWVSVGACQNPENWSSFNNFFSFGVPEMSFKTADSHSGFALRLISDTATIPPPLGTNVLDTLAGYVFLGGAEMNNPGIAYTDRPVLMKAFVKGTIISGSEAYIIAKLRKWNSITNTRDQVGQAMYFFANSIATYTEVSVAFNYTLSVLPDTLEIKLMGGNVGPGGVIKPGNEIFIDDISFTFPVGIKEENSNQPIVTVSPNPTSGKLIVSSLEKINLIEIYNILEEKVLSVNYPIQSGSNEIDLTNYHRGVYFLKTFCSGKTNTQKIVLQ
jgi:hypothetical protein